MKPETISAASRAVFAARQGADFSPAGSAVVVSEKASMKEKPIQLESEVAERPIHEHGRQVQGDVYDAIREEFKCDGGCHVSGGSVYHDYFALTVARVFPNRGDGERVMAAVRRALPLWRRVMVSIHRETNSVGVICYAHDVISSGPASLAGRTPVAKEGVAA